MPPPTLSTDTCNNDDDYQTLFTNNVKVYAKVDNADVCNAALQTNILGVSENAYIKNLDVTGLSSFAGEVNVNELHVHGTSDLDGNTNIGVESGSSQLTVNSSATLMNGVTVTGDSTFNNKLTVTDGGLTVDAGGATVNGATTLYAPKNLNGSPMLDSDGLRVPTLVVNGNEFVDGSLIVTGALKLSTLGVENLEFAHADGRSLEVFTAKVSEETTLNSKPDFTGFPNTGTSLTVNGKEVIHGPSETTVLSTAPTPAYTDSLSVYGNATVTGSLSVGSLQIQGTLSSDIDVVKRVNISADNSGDSDTGVAELIFKSEYCFGAYFIMIDEIVGKDSDKSLDNGAGAIFASCIKSTVQKINRLSSIPGKDSGSIGAMWVPPADPSTGDMVLKIWKTKDTTISSTGNNDRWYVVRIMSPTKLAMR